MADARWIVMASLAGALLHGPVLAQGGAARVAAPAAFLAGALRAEYQAEPGTSYLRATFHNVADSALRLIFRRGVNRVSLGSLRGSLDLDFASDAPMDMATGDSLSFLVRHELVDPEGGRHLVVQGRIVARAVGGELRLVEEGVSLHRLGPPRPAPRRSPGHPAPAAFP